MIVLVLALDTSTPTMTAGVVRLLRPHELAELMQAAAESPTDTPPDPCTVLAEHSVTDAFGHAEHLMPLATAALAESGHALADIEAVVVGIGPGPFTGLRVGMATAAALGDALDVGVHGVPSHDAMARTVVATADGDFVIATDARRKEVYLSVFSTDATRRFGSEALAPADVAIVLAQQGLSPVFAAGAGAGLIAEILGLPTVEPAQRLSGALVTCAAQALLTGAIPGPLAPLYLRRPDAAEPHGPKAVLPTAPTEEPR